MVQPTEGERQAAEQLAEYNRDNYKRWPWTSFLIVAVFSGIILVVSASPSNMSQMAIHQKVLSAVFIFISILLLIPSVAGIIFHAVYMLCKSLDKPFPCQAFRDRMTGVPGRKDKKLAASASSAPPPSVSVWTAETAQAPRSGHADREHAAGYYPEPPPTYDDDRRARELAGYGRGYDPYSRPRDAHEGVHRAVIEHDRQRPKREGNNRQDHPTLSEQARMHTADSSTKDTQGKGRLWRDSEGQLVLHI